MPKKCGILSMQRICNYGSFLQAYGLEQVLLELGLQVEFVDYHIEDCLIYSKKGFSRKLGKVFEVLSIKAPFFEKIKYINYKKNYSKKYLPMLGIEEGVYNYNPNLDTLIIGSDEVFNCIQDNLNVGFSPELFGVNSNAKKIISYAGSFGNTSIEKINSYLIKDKLSNWFNAFDAISVRDQNSFEIIKEVSGRDAEIDLDPVLIYNYMNNCPLIPDYQIPYKYLVLYGYTGRFSKTECKIITKFAKKNNLKIICIGGIQHCCNRFIDANPFEVLSIFKKASFIITDTFHGTIFSIICKRKFATFIRVNGYGNNQKLSDLLKRVSLEDRIINSVELLDKYYTTDIDYTNTDLIIEQYREKTYNYLKDNI